MSVLSICVTDRWTLRFNYNTSVTHETQASHTRFALWAGFILLYVSLSAHLCWHHHLAICRSKGKKWWKRCNLQPNHSWALVGLKEQSHLYSKNRIMARSKVNTARIKMHRMNLMKMSYWSGLAKRPLTVCMLLCGNETKKPLRNIIL